MTINRPNETNEALDAFFHLFVLPLCIAAILSMLLMFFFSGLWWLTDGRLLTETAAQEWLVSNSDYAIEDLTLIESSVSSRHPALFKFQAGEEVIFLQCELKRVPPEDSWQVACKQTYEMVYQALKNM